MAYLLDTNVISELRKVRRCDVSVAAWRETIDPNECYISVISLAEIKGGILRTKDAAFSTILERWYSDILKPNFRKRILPISPEIAERCGEVIAGRTRGLADCLIAATASVHDLTIATRNIADFNDLGGKLVNPWEFAP